MINEDKDKDKDIFDMLGEMEVNLDEYEQQELTDIEKIKLKKNFRKTVKKDNSKKYIAAASIFIVSLGIISQTQIGAYAHSIIEDITEILKLSLGVDDRIEQYSYDINQSVTRRKLNIKIEDAILNGDELIIHMSKDYGKTLKENEYIDITSEYLYVNDKLLNPSIDSYYGDYYKVKENYVYAYNLSQEYKGDINVKLRIMSAQIKRTDDEDYVRHIIGPWTFKFTIDGDKLDKDTKNIKLNQEIQLDTDSTMKLENYRGNFLGQKIKLSMTGHKNLEDEKNSIDIKLKGRDNLGNKVEFMPIIGNISSKDTNFIYSYDDSVRKFDEKASKLYLTPYLYTLDKNSKDAEFIYKKIGDEFTIDLSK